MDLMSKLRRIFRFGKEPSRLKPQSIIPSIAVAACLLFACACGKNKGEGVFRSAASGTVIELNAGKASATVMGQSLQGTYAQKDNEIVLTFGNEVQTAKLSEDGSTLSLT